MPPLVRLARHLVSFWRGELSPGVPPFRLWVDITSRCNLTCTACPQRLLSSAQRRDMAPEVLERLVRECAGRVGLVNLFHRGEPLLHPELGLWVRRFRAAGCAVRIHTNATLLDRGRVAMVLAAGPDLLTCSLDTLHSGDYAAARRGARLERALTGLEYLLVARRRLGLRRPRVGLLLMGPQRRDPAYRARLVRLRALGLDRLLWRAPHNWAGAVGGVAALGQDRLHRCTFPWYGLAVLSDGRVTPCPQDFFGKLVLGLLPEGGLVEAWQGAAARSLRAAHLQGTLQPFPTCLACDRIRRPTLLGLPREHLKNFLAESIVGAARRRP